jgi:DNA uptake protein ComE-like DNA-binding protein
MSSLGIISARAPNRQRGSVLIIVLWICLGLVTLTLYFANSMSSELRAADNRVNEAAARQAVAGGTRYAMYVLTNYVAKGAVPDVQDFKAEAVPVGDAQFWFIGRNNDVPPTTDPTFGFVDESSKLNLNTATSAMLQGLPGMTPDLVDAIVAWRSRANSAAGANADNTYSQLDPPRHNKGGNFETVDELRLVNGATLDILLAEDTNRNGVLDANEDDGDDSAPHDNQDGQLLAGILEYVTVYSHQPATSAAGGQRIDIRTQQSRTQQNALERRLTQRGIQPDRARQILQRAGNNTYASVMDFLLGTQMTSDEFALVHTDFSATDNGQADGLVNVNTATAVVLSCLPGIGPDNAATIVAYRQAHPDVLNSFAWLVGLIPAANLRTAGRYITDQSYQFSADIAAVGANGRGYCRERVVFDTTGSTPRIVYRQDLTPFGWALGSTTRQSLRAPKNT